MRKNRRGRGIQFGKLIPTLPCVGESEGSDVIHALAESNAALSLGSDIACRPEPVSRLPKAIAEALGTSGWHLHVANECTQPGAVNTW